MGRVGAGTRGGDMGPTGKNMETGFKKSHHSTTWLDVAGFLFQDAGESGRDRPLREKDADFMIVFWRIVFAGAMLALIVNAIVNLRKGR